MDTPSLIPIAVSAAARKPGSRIMLHYVMEFAGTGFSVDMAEIVKAGKSSIGKKLFGGQVCLSAAVTAKDDINARLQESIRFGSEWNVVRSMLSEHGEVDFEASLDDLIQGRARLVITG